MVGSMSAYYVLFEAAKEKNLENVMLYELYDIPAKKAYYIIQYNKR